MMALWQALGDAAATKTLRVAEMTIIGRDHIRRSKDDVSSQRTQYWPSVDWV